MNDLRTYLTVKALGEPNALMVPEPIRFGLALRLWVELAKLSFSYLSSFPSPFKHLFSGPLYVGKWYHVADIHDTRLCYRQSDDFGTSLIECRVLAVFVIHALISGGTFFSTAMPSWPALWTAWPASCLGLSSSPCWATWRRWGRWRWRMWPRIKVRRQASNPKSYHVTWHMQQIL